VNISVAYAIFSPADRGNQEVKKINSLSWDVPSPQQAGVL